MSKDKSQRNKKKTSKHERKKVSEMSTPTSDDKFQTTTAKKKDDMNNTKSKDNKNNNKKKKEAKKDKGKKSGSREEKTNTLVSGSRKIRKEKWAGEEAASKWAKKLQETNVISEYEEIKKIKTSLEKCKSWEQNMSKNRHAEYKCYDDNRVVLQASKCDYINASKIDLSVYQFPRPVLLAQLPKLDSVDAVEEFWRMIFNEECSFVHIIAQPGEITEGLDKLFVQEVGKFLYANGFFISTRKLEKGLNDKMDIFTIELLPEGCADAVMTQVYVHNYWTAQGGPEKFHAPIKAAQLIAKTDVDKKPVALVSVCGAGRNASLLALAVTVDMLNKGNQPNIKDIVKSIREQRPLAVDSVTQYISIFLATCWLVKAKTHTHDVVMNLKKFKLKCDPTSSQMSMATFEDTKEQ